MTISSSQQTNTSLPVYHWILTIDPHRPTMSPKKRSEVSPSAQDSPNKKKKTAGKGEQDRSDKPVEQKGDNSGSEDPIFRRIRLLKPIPATKGYMTGRETGDITKISIRTAFGQENDAVNRLENFIVAPISSTLVNLGTCDPDKFRPTGKYNTVMLTSNSRGRATLFFLVGIVSHSQMFTGINGRQLCIVPSDITWNRALAAMGCFFHQRKLALSTFKNGVSFSTLKKTAADTPGRKLSMAGMSSTSTSAFTESSNRNGPLPADSDIPTYEGRSSFHLERYREQPMRDTELAIGSAVLVIFTLGAYHLRDGDAMNYGVTMGVSTNIQSVLVLSDPPSNNSDRPLQGPKTPPHLGVQSDTESSEGEEGGGEAVDNEEPGFFM